MIGLFRRLPSQLLVIAIRGRGPSGRVRNEEVLERLNRGYERIGCWHGFARVLPHWGYTQAVKHPYQRASLKSM